MNKLIIITGISGTGKTTLAKTLYNKIENSTVLSYDELSESIYDIVGFKNINEKRTLQLLNEDMYKRLIEESMKRKDKVIILDKPFRKEWRDFFDSLTEKYSYKVYTINMFAESFDIVWKRLLKREKSKKERHPSHYLSSYCLKNKENYNSYFEYDYNSLKEEYDKLISNSINLGNIININDIEKINLCKLIEEIF